MIHLPLLIAQETQTVRQVSFLNWDSDAERERSQRGAHFRHTSDYESEVESERRPWNENNKSKFGMH